ncbi:MAG: DUF3047 domain-containing protein [Burkholderiales bacterium]
MEPDARRRRLLSAAPALTLIGLTGCVTPPPDTPGRTYPAVPAFSGAAAGGPTPEGWRPYLLRPDRMKTVYSMEQRAGRTVLRAVADSAASGLSCAVDIDPRRTPWLRWEWRADNVHAKATVAHDVLEDTPARLVVAFGGDIATLPLRDRIFFEQVEVFTGNVLPFATLTYVWDGQLPVGTMLSYGRSDRIRYDVVESGVARAGQWLRYERNVLDDYQRVFGEALKGHVSSVGVLTDSDDLKNHVEAWYGDIGLYAARQGRFSMATGSIASAGTKPNTLA